MSEEVKNEKPAETPAAAAPAAPAAPAPQKLALEEKDRALRFAHQFFSSFDRVPGYAAAQWSQALDAIGLVINSLVAERTEKKEEK